jgi:hypothetical protein
MSAFTFYFEYFLFRVLDSSARMGGHSARDSTFDFFFFHRSVQLIPLMYIRSAAIKPAAMSAADSGCDFGAFLHQVMLR